MQDAEDLAGDTVYKLLVNRDKFDCSKPLQPWCLIIMRNTYIIEIPLYILQGLIW